MFDRRNLPHKVNFVKDLLMNRAPKAPENFRDLGIKYREFSRHMIGFRYQTIGILISFRAAYTV